MKHKKKKCKICNKEFMPYYTSLQPTCFNSSCVLAYSKKVNDKKWRKEKKVRLAKLKTHSEYLKELQVIFNKWIRLRDKGLNCISCDKPNGSEQSGHYRSVGGNPELRFNEYNARGQCIRCNMYLHGNLIDYRVNLIKKIGIEKVEWLEGFHEIKRYTIPELKEMKIEYRNKIKELEK